MATVGKLTLAVCLSATLAACSAGPSQAPLRSQFGGTEPGVPSRTRSETQPVPQPPEPARTPQIPTR